MKLKPIDSDEIILKPHGVPPLNQLEKHVADIIAEELRRGKDDGDIEPGLLIWKWCNEYGVDHHKIAKRLGHRAKKDS